MNNKKAKALKKEARRFATNFGFKTEEIYKQLKKTGKGVSINKK